MSDDEKADKGKQGESARAHRKARKNEKVGQLASHPEGDGLKSNQREKEDQSESMNLDDKLYLVRYKVDDRTHLRVVDQEICRRSGKEHGHVCTHICPAGVYEWTGEEITVEYERCVECGACRIACPDNNIDWEYPRGGFGIVYKHG